MSNRVVRLALMLAIVGAVLAIGASVTHAQQHVMPVIVVSCTDVSRFDLNRDGMVNGDDFTLWVKAVHEPGAAFPECRLDGPASACPAWADVNGDGKVSLLDLDWMAEYLRSCVQLVRNTQRW
jgi:hypothetical protein